jgi:hypothetical protein
MSDRFGPAVDAALSSLSLPSSDDGPAPTSSGRFADGAAARLEIPSTEGPGCLEAVLEEAERLEVPVTRVSQGSGVAMLTDDELRRMAATAADAGVEVSLFARPNAGWGPSASARASAGSGLAASAWGLGQLRACLEDVLRAASHGFRSVLVADVGVLAGFAALRRSGHLPSDMQAKVSVMLPAANPAAAKVLEEVGAGTLNVPSDLHTAQLAAIRAAVPIPIDVYVESPDELGGLVRIHEAAEILRVAAPVHLKLGLRNAPALYPYGRHLERVAIEMSRERVRRARLLIETLARAGVHGALSVPGAAGLAVPVPRAQE